MFKRTLDWISSLFEKRPQLVSEEDALLVDLMEMCDKDSGWDREGRKAAAHAFLVRGWTREDVVAIYGEELVTEIESVQNPP